MTTTRTMSLVRIEPHLSPTYLMICIDHDDVATPDAIKEAKFRIELGAPPEGIFMNVAAVIREGLSRPPHLFSVVETKVVSPDLEWDDLSRGRQEWASLFDLSEV